MDKSTEAAIATENQENPNAFSRALKVIAYPFALVAGFWATNVRVHNSAYNVARTLKGFEDILGQETPKSEKEMAQRIAGELEKDEFFSRAINNRLSYTKAATERMEHLGLDSFYKKWRYIAEESKQVAIIEGLTISGIAIGALLTMANSKRLTTLFSRKHTEEDAQER